MNGKCVTLCLCCRYLENGDHWYWNVLNDSELLHPFFNLLEWVCDTYRIRFQIFEYQPFLWRYLIGWIWRLIICKYGQKYSQWAGKIRNYNIFNVCHRCFTYDFCELWMRFSSSLLLFIASIMLYSLVRMERHP